MSKRNKFLGGAALGAMTPVERAQGRYMRSPDGHLGGGDPSAGLPDAGGTPPAGGGQNNGSGNDGTGTQTGSQQDNTRQEPDPAAFWNEPAPKSDDNNNSGGGNNNDSDDPGADLGAQIAKGIQEADFGSVFTPEIGEAIAEGNLESVNAAMQEQGRKVLQAAVVQAARITESMTQQILKEVDQRMNSQFSGREDSEALSEAFPTMADPAMRPVITGVFKQALKHTGNDRSKAIEMTKGMLRVMGKSGQQDFGIPPTRDANDSLSDGSSSLIEELLGR